MLNRLHGQPESYDKKYVRCLWRYAGLRATLTAAIQIQVPIRSNAGRRHLWHRPGGRGANRQGRYQDYLEEKRQGKRAHGIRRAGDAAEPTSPSYRSVCRLVRVEGTAQFSATLCQPRSLNICLRTSTTLSLSWPRAASSSTGSASKASLRRRMPPRRSSRCLTLSITFIAGTSSTEVSR